MTSDDVTAEVEVFRAGLAAHVLAHAIAIAVVDVIDSPVVDLGNAALGVKRESMSQTVIGHIARRIVRVTGEPVIHQSHNAEVLSRAFGDRFL